MGSLLYWPLACLLMASGQGLLMPAIRRTPPGAEARRQDVALHVLLLAAYFLPLAWMLFVNCQLIIDNCIAAVAARLLLFDVMLNLASGAPAFAVGSTARFDKVLRWLAARLSWPAERVRLAVWLLSIAAAMLCYYLIK